MIYRNRTEQIIMEACVLPGGWKHAQLHAWGVPTPPPKGWKSKLIEADALRGHNLSSSSESSPPLPPAQQRRLFEKREDAWTPWGRLSQGSAHEPEWAILKSAYGYVYLIENIYTGAGYIGIHRVKLEEPWGRYMSSSALVKKLRASSATGTYRKVLLRLASSESELVFLEGLYAVAFSKTHRKCLNGDLHAFRNMVFGSKRAHAMFYKRYAREIKALRGMLTASERKALSKAASSVATPSKRRVKDRKMSKERKEVWAQRAMKSRNQEELDMLADRLLSDQ